MNDIIEQTRKLVAEFQKTHPGKRIAINKDGSTSLVDHCDRIDVGGQIMSILERERLQQAYPEIPFPMRCENGCGAVIASIDAFHSYQRNEDGEPKLICECCASEIGHMDEENEDHDESPKCKRKPKVQR